MLFHEVGEDAGVGGEAGEGDAEVGVYAEDFFLVGGEFFCVALDEGRGKGVSLMRWLVGWLMRGREGVPLGLPGRCVFYWLCRRRRNLASQLRRHIRLGRCGLAGSCEDY